MSEPVRTLVVAVPDWPVVAAGVAPTEPGAVLHANRVVAASPMARAEGVVPGLRRREAQGRCPALVVLDHDPARDARAFEPVVAAIETITPRLEITVPGVCAFPTRGPSRYFGGDDAIVERVRSLAAGALAFGVPVNAGIADGPFAAGLAAVRDQVVAPGAAASAAFLAPFPLAALGLAYDELTDVLGRLGLRTLGDLAALPAASVTGRFGADGAAAHRLASGRDERHPATRPPAPEWTVDVELDPPVDRVDTVAFVARTLAGDLAARLVGEGLVCTRVAIVAESEHGERHERLWRAEAAGAGGGFTAGAMADRVRWQLDGWLNGSARHRPTAGITLLRLVPDEVVAATGRQLGFWGGAAGADERALRALARLEGMLGPESVTVPEWRGGRGPGERVVLVPAGAVAIDEDRAAATIAAAAGREPWPGHIPDPAPATVPLAPVAADVVGPDGAPVAVSGRGLVSAHPTRLRVGDGNWVTVAAWAGPWPAEERWWDPTSKRRRARFQMVGTDGIARLLTIEGNRWWLEAVYD